MTTDIDRDRERVLVERLHALAAHARTDTSAPVRALPTLQPAPRPRRRTVVAVAASFAVCVVVVGLVVVSRRDSTVRVRTTPVVSVDGAGQAVDVLPKAPIEGRAGHAVVWTGSEFVVWGGDKPRSGSGSGEIALADGAAYDPATRMWRILAKAPIAARSLPAYVWTGSELIIWGGYDNGQPVRGGAAYDPAHDTWRLIADAPITSRQAPAATWTGREMIVVGGFDGGHLTNDAMAYNPAENSWRTLPTPPGLPVAPRPQAVSYDGRVVLLMSAADGPGQQTFVAGFDPQTNRWTTYAAAPIPSSSTPQVGVLGSELFVLTNSADRPGAALDLGTNTWRTLAVGPGLAVYSWTFVGRRAVFWSGGAVGAVYDVDQDAWRVFDAGDRVRREDHVVVSGSDVAFSWGGFVSGGPTWSGAADGVILRPSVETAPLPPDSIPKATSFVGSTTPSAVPTVPSRCATTSPSRGC